VSDIFREIDEELRRDNFAKLWKQYGKYIVTLAVVIVVVAGAVVAWRQYQATQRAAEGERFAVALDLIRQGKTKEAGETFASLSLDSASRAVLARLEAASLAAKAGDAAKAQAAYAAIAADPSAEQGMRDLASLLAAQYALDGGDPKQVVTQLQAMATGGGAWQPSAIELTALAQLKAGDKAAARATYQRLADDLTAPQGMRARAAEMVAALAP